MSELAKATVRIEADISDLDAGLALAVEKMEGVGKTLEGLGKTLSTKVTLPLLAIGTLAVHEFGEAADALAKLDAVLAATGGVSGTTASHVREVADALQQTTRFSNDAVIGASALLATFQNVRNEVGAGNDVFDRAIKNAADLSATMGTDLTTAIEQLGRALEQPASGLQLLRRAGVQFSAAEQAQIKILVEHGNVLEAQRVILDKVEGKGGVFGTSGGGSYSGGMHEVERPTIETERGADERGDSRGADDE